MIVIVTESPEKALGLGTWLVSRKGGMPWKPVVDDHGLNLVGEPFGFKAAGLFLHSDLKALWTSFGFASIVTTLARCCIYQCDRATWANL